MTGAIRVTRFRTVTATKIAEGAGDFIEVLVPAGRRWRVRGATFNDDTTGALDAYIYVVSGAQTSYVGKTITASADITAYNTVFPNGDYQNELLLRYGDSINLMVLATVALDNLTFNLMVEEEPDDIPLPT